MNRLAAQMVPSWHHGAVVVGAAWLCAGRALRTRVSVRSGYCELLPMTLGVHLTGKCEPGQPLSPYRFILSMRVTRLTPSRRAASLWLP